MFLNPDFSIERKIMVEHQIRNRGIYDERVLSVFEKVPRHLFVPTSEEMCAYDDNPLGIGCNQTISQPYMVALMTSILNLTKDDKVLEIGTGSGYQTAILSELAGEIYTIERFSELSNTAKKVLDMLGYDNINYIIGDGTAGFIDAAPFDKIIVTAGSGKLPEPLKNQIKLNGSMVIPVGERYMQVLLKITRLENDYKIEEYGHCIFVPLVGQYS